MSPIGASNAIPYAGSAPVSGPDQSLLIQAVKDVNAAQSLGSDRELTFAVDRETRHVVVRIIDSSTGEILDQIPKEQVLQLAEKLK